MKSKKIFYAIIVSLVFNYSFTYAQWTTNLNQNTACNAQFGAEQPMTASTKDGKTYISYYKVGVGGNYNMYMQLLDASGNRMWGNDGIVVTSYNSSTYTTLYDLTVDTAGNAIVSARYFDGTSDRLFVSKYNQIGNPLWGANGITIGVGGEGGPKLLVTPSNNLIVGDAYTGELFKLSPAGSILWSNNIPASNYDIRKLVGTNSEDFIAIYRKATFMVYGKLNAMKYDATGTAKWANPIVVSDQTVKGYQQDYHVSDGNNGFYSGFSNDNFGCYLQHISDTGAVKWGVSGVVFSADTFQFAISGMAFNAVQNKLYAIAAITDINQLNYGTKFQKIDTNGNLLLTANGLTLHGLASGMPNQGLIAVNNGLAYSYTDTASVIKVDKLDSVGNFIWQKNACTVNSSKGSCSLNYSNFVTPSATSAGINNFQTVIVWQDGRNSNGTGIYAQNFIDTANIPFPASINSFEKPNSIKLYPNPSNGTQVSLFINSNVTEPITITTVDVSGKIIHTEVKNLVQGENTYNLNLNNISAGIYFINCVSETYKFNLKWNCIK